MFPTRTDMLFDFLICRWNRVSRYCFYGVAKANFIYRVKSTADCWNVRNSKSPTAGCPIFQIISKNSRAAWNIADSNFVSLVIEYFDCTAADRLLKMTTRDVFHIFISK